LKCNNFVEVDIFEKLEVCPKCKSEHVIQIEKDNEKQASPQKNQPEKEVVEIDKQKVSNKADWI